MCQERSAEEIQNEKAVPIVKEVFLTHSELNNFLNGLDTESKSA